MEKQEDGTLVKSTPSSENPPVIDIAGEMEGMATRQRAWAETHEAKKLEERLRKLPKTITDIVR